jgi:hypothetical protein
MGILDRARQDMQKILTDLSGFAVEVDITLNSETVKVGAIFSNHHVKISDTGVPVNSKKASITVHEKALNDAGLQIRNADGEVNLYKAHVTYKDSSGLPGAYYCSQFFPDETTGNIVMMLQKDIDG